MKTGSDDEGLGGGDAKIASPKDGAGEKLLQLWKGHGITSMSELEAAARAGRLRSLPAVGEKGEARVLLAIEAYRKRADAPKHRPLADAMLAGEALCERVRAVPTVLACEVAGGLRRRAEMVAEFDLVVACDPMDAASVVRAFVESPGFHKLLSPSSSEPCAILDGGIHVHLRVVQKESWGSALQHFTGSHAHNVALQSVAAAKGLDVNERGVFDANGGKLAGSDETGVYEALGLRWIAPEMREQRGELEAAAGNALPRLVELADLRGDLHMHTTETDGTSSLEQMADAARLAGHSYIAITEHSEALAFVRGMSRERLRAQRHSIRTAEEKLGGAIRLFAGIETDILADGTLDLEDALGEVEWVVGSVHQHFKMTKDEMTTRVVRAIESGKMDCLGHPTGRQLGFREPTAIDLEAVLAAMKRTGVAIELNCSPHRLDIDEHTARRAREVGVPVVLNSDAHSARELSYQRYGIGIARRAWLSAGDVLNTRSAAQVQEWRLARRARS